MRLTLFAQKQQFQDENKRVFQFLQKGMSCGVICLMPLFQLLAACSRPDDTQIQSKLQSKVTQTSSANVLLPQTSALSSQHISKFEHAVAQIEAESNLGVGFCSGVFIAPNALLTADHCVRDKSAVIYRFRDRAAFSEQSEAVYGQVVPLHPNPPANCLVNGAAGAITCLQSRYFDISLVVFPKAVATATLPLQLLAPPGGTQVGVLGFGPEKCTESAQSVESFPREPVSILSFLGTLPAVNIRPVTRWITFAPNDLPQICAGDSGGPWIDPKTGGVFAVTSANAVSQQGYTRSFSSTVEAVKPVLMAALAQYALRANIVN